MLCHMVYAGCASRGSSNEGLIILPQAASGMAIGLWRWWAHELLFLLNPTVNAEDMETDSTIV